MKFAPNTLTLFKDQDPMNQFMSINKCGFSYIEFLFPYMVPVKKAKAILEAFNLRVSIIDVLPGDLKKMDISAAIDPARKDEFRNYAKMSLEYAGELNVPNINCLSGCAPAVPGVSREEMMDLYKENLAYTCDLFKDTGQTILLEPVSGFQFPGYLTGDLPEAASIIEALNRPNLSLQFDFFHIQLLHGNLAGNLDKYYDITGYYQVANTPNRNQPGYGEINFPYLLNILKRKGYEGFVGLEYEPVGASEDSFGWLGPYR